MNSLIYENDVTRGRGRIEVILGPMFSGKTTELIRRITRFRLACFKCIVFKYAGDVRYSEANVSTHDLQSIPAVSCVCLMDHLNEADESDVVGIDEGQFFPEVIDFCEKLANRGKIVVVAALDGTYKRTAFGEILKLIPMAENVIKLNSVCMVCFQNASFTKRISNEKDIEIIGGSDKYMAVCRNCYHAANTPKICENFIIA